MGTSRKFGTRIATPATAKWRLAAALVLSIGAAAALAMLVDWQRIWAALTALDPGLLAAAVVLFLLYQALRTVRLLRMARSPAPVGHFFSGVVMQGAANSVLPAGLGEIVLVWIMRTFVRIDWSRGFAVVLAARIADMLVLSMAALLALYLSRDILPAGFHMAALALFAFAILALTVILVLARRTIRTRNGHLRGSLRRKLGTRLRWLMRAIRQIGGYGTMSWIAVITCGIWTANFASTWTVINALGLPLHLSQFLWIYLLTFPVNLMPFKTVGNVGAFEANWVVILLALGFPAETALDISVAAHIGVLLVLAISVLAAVAGQLLVSGVKYEPKQRPRHENTLPDRTRSER